MILAATAIELRLSRFQVLAVLASCLALAGAISFFVLSFASDPIDHRCLSIEDYPDGICTPDSVQAWAAQIRTAWALLPVLVAIPWVAGILVGAPLVAQEIEYRTAVVAWSLGPSRARWLLRRVSILLPILLALVGVPALLAIGMQAVARPLVSPLATYENYGAFGPLLIARAALAFAISLFIGAWVGRLLPAIVLSAAACALAALAATVIGPMLLPSVELTASPSNTIAIGVSSAYRLPDGRLVPDWTAVLEASPYARGTQEFDDWETSLERVEYGLPASTAGELAIRESLVTLAAAVVVLGGSVVIIRGRRPY